MSILGSKTTNDHAITLIADGTEFKGDITFDRELVIAGSVVGSVSCAEDAQGTLRILESGSFSGEVNVPLLEVYGHLDATTTCSGQITIGEKAHVSGLIRFGRMAVSPGAVITGELISTAEDNQ